MITTDATLCQDCLEDCGMVVEALGFVTDPSGRRVNVCADHGMDYEDDPYEDA